VNEALLWEAVKHYRAAVRQGTHATKNRKLVAGSGKKLWKQKGTGRARRLGAFSSLASWRHGPRTSAAQLRLRLPAQEAAGRVAFGSGSKLADGKLTIVDSLELKEGKTKLYRAALDKLGANRTTLMVESGKTSSRKLVLGVRNLDRRGAGAQQRGSSLRSAALRARHLLEGRD
jgi:large subunit ribosomal protein L4